MTIGVVQQIKAIAVLIMKPAVRVDTSVTMLIVTVLVFSSNGDMEYEPMLKLYPSTPKP